MKYVYMRKSRLSLIICCCVLVLGMASLYIAGMLKNTPNTGVFCAADGESVWEVRNRILLEAMDYTGACEPKKAAEVWAEGVKKRNAGMQYAVMCKRLKEEYIKSLEKNAPYWVTGVSSPWVESYAIEDIAPADENFKIRLVFSLSTSTGPAGKYKALLTVTRENDFFCISKVETDEGLKAYTGM